jgi:hypothetical protein
MRTKSTLLAVGACALAACMAASAAHAKTVTVTDVELPNATTGYLSGPSPSYNGEVYVGETDLTVNGKVVATFCDDPFDEINTGAGQSLPFTVGTLSMADSFNGVHLSGIQVNKITALAKEGLASTDVTFQQEVQAAIWDEEGDSLTFSDPSMTAAATSLATHALNFDNTADYEYLSTSGAQSFVASAVPEPSTWALMLAGVAGLGMMLRFNRHRSGSALLA